MITRKEAVEQSIEKWEGIVAGGEEEGGCDCGFCEYFEHTGLKGCDQCPIGKVESVALAIGYILNG